MIKEYWVRYKSVEDINYPIYYVWDNSSMSQTEFFTIMGRNYLKVINKRYVVFARPRVSGIESSLIGLN